jgi:hypothetical protein
MSPGSSQQQHLACQMTSEEEDFFLQVPTMNLLHLLQG